MIVTRRRRAMERYSKSNRGRPRPAIRACAGRPAIPVIMTSPERRTCLLVGAFPGGDMVGRRHASSMTQVYRREDAPSPRTRSRYRANSVRSSQYSVVCSCLSALCLVRFAVSTLRHESCIDLHTVARLPASLPTSAKCLATAKSRIDPAVPSISRSCRTWLDKSVRQLNNGLQLQTGATGHETHQCDY